jgi:AdoMet-dependent heme synthase
MHYADIIQRTRADNHLFSALIELTYRCNLDCFFCYNDTALKGTPLSLEQYFQLFEELRALGTMELTLSGGEPLAHPHFFQLGAHARELGFVVRIKSNGHALRGLLAQRIKKTIDPFMIEVSLHGATAAVHDRQTRVPGSLEQLLKNLSAMQEIGLRFKLNSALTRWNEHQIEEMYALAETFGVPLQFDTTVTPRDDGNAEPLSIAPSQEGIQALFRFQMRRSSGKSENETNDLPGDRKARRQSGGRHCGAGASTIAVDPYGTVYPCVQWHRAIGSLHNDGIAAIWSDNETLAEIRRENERAARTVDALGRGKEAAAFCPGLADNISGSPTVIYLEARLRQTLWREVRSDRNDPAVKSEPTKATP